jgi:hypothetical protein
MATKTSVAGVAKAKSYLSRKQPYIKFSQERNKDADMAGVPVPARGKQLGAEWALAKKELGIAIPPKKKTTKTKAKASKK